MIRNRFFTGRFLTAEDLNHEQEYFREKHKRHNRTLHGFGVVTGLGVSKSSGNTVTIAAGLAIDCEGNEILVEESFKYALPASALETIFLTLRYAEHAIDPIPTTKQSSDMEFSKVEETFDVVFETQNTNQGHRHFRGRWRACGKPHGLTIARLKRTSGNWRVERRYHPPRLS